MKCLHHFKIFMLLLGFLKSVESKIVMLCSNFSLLSIRI